MRSFISAVFTVSVAILAAQNIAKAQTMPTGVLPQIGTVQQQDLDSAKRLEQERRGIRDYRNYKKNI